MKDIEKSEDIVLLVNEFYTLILKDELLSPFFKNLNFDHHLPRMVNFWEFVLLDKSGYTTDVTAVHMKMHLAKEHFEQWIKLFNQTVDSKFIGPKADLAKQRAYLVGLSIESKM